jgi:hypothetical protein
MFCAVFAVMLNAFQFLAFFAVFLDCLNALAVGAPFEPGLRMVSFDPAAIRFFFAAMFAYRPLPGTFSPLTFPTFPRQIVWCIGIVRFGFRKRLFNP